MLQCTCSLEETLSHLVFALEAGYIQEALYKELENEGDEIDKMPSGYISYLKKRRQGASEPGVNHAVREESLPYSDEALEDFTNTETTTL